MKDQQIYLTGAVPVVSIVRRLHPGSLPHITGFSPGITRTPCRKFNKEEKIEVLGSIRVHFLTHDLGRPIELLMFYCSF